MKTTADVLVTEENRTGGILVVTGAETVPANPVTRLAFFSDAACDRGPVIRRFVEWFNLWGMPLIETRGKEGAFERAFTMTVWPAVKPKGHGPQTVPETAREIAALTEVLNERKPRLIIFLSCYLWQAVNTEAALPLVEKSLGRRLDAGRRISSTRLAAYEQHFERARILALPLPSKNTTDAFVTALAQPVQRFFKAAGLASVMKTDADAERAAEFLVLDREASIQCIRTGLHISVEKAAALFESLAGNVWEKDAAGRLLLKRRSQ